MRQGHLMIKKAKVKENQENKFWICFYEHGKLFKNMKNDGKKVK
jgi:hypothetical protein